MSDNRATELATIIEALTALASALTWTQPNCAASVSSYMKGAWAAIDKLKDECLREVAGIVRCKDCKWFDDVHQEPALCYAPGMCQHEAQPDGFCSWGELREGSE